MKQWETKKVHRRYRKNSTLVFFETDRDAKIVIISKPKHFKANESVLKRAWLFLIKPLVI